jgi:hypothetical protein
MAREKLTWRKTEPKSLPDVLKPLYMAAHDAAEKKDKTQTALRDAWRKLKSNPRIVVSVKPNGTISWAEMSGTASEAEAF